MMKDSSVSDLEKSRKILESLLVPASDVIRHLGPEALLDSAFATVEDGEELFAQFMNTLQESGEKPSTYLQRLQVALNNAVHRGGVPVQEVDKHLLKLFCRGCWDNNMLADLHLEHKKHNSPSFAELLLLLKAPRGKRHLGGSIKQKAVMHVQNVCDCGAAQAGSDTNSIHEKHKETSCRSEKSADIPHEKEKKNLFQGGTTESD